MKNYKTPKQLEPGSTIGVIAPASAAKRKPTKLGLEYLEKQGYTLKTSTHLTKGTKYLAADDNVRIKFLEDFLLDPEVDAIICVRGGYGMLRIIDKLDYDKISAVEPKILVGYSDITALQMSLLQKCGWVTYSGPMVASEMGNNFSQFSENWLWKVLTKSNEKLNFQNPENDEIKIINPGQAEGNLIGGCLSLVTPLLNTEYMPPLDGNILFLEDVGEPGYKVDKMLQTLKLHKVFDKISGLVIGKFSGTFKENDKKNFTLEQLLLDTIPKIDFPIIANFAYGHIDQRFTIPIGGKFRMDTDKGEYTYLR